MSDDILFEYNWTDAVRDGVFVDVSTDAKEIWGVCPIALSCGVHETFIGSALLPEVALASLLTAFKAAAILAPSPTNYFEFPLRDVAGEEHTICAVCGPKGSKDPSPCITLYFPHED